ncbi:MAG: PhzF family phenazine biosynthesis protein [Desulfobacterium sp.]|nr:PhzF family phenazine biosynthesis protein [Desulfobacterium sp.]
MIKETMGANMGVGTRNGEPKRELTFKKMDAFATERSSGNPAGYIRLDSLADISDAEMLQIAKELKGFVNEVGYMSEISERFFDLRYFSSEREVDFCGHATVAIMYDLIKNDENLQKFDELHIRTNSGTLSVENRISREDAVFIMSPAPVHKTVSLDASTIAEKLKIKPEEIDTDYPISVINAGLSTLLVPIKTLESILAILPDLEELKQFCFDSGIDIIEVFTHDVADERNHFRTRVFAGTFGYLEDPATGTGNSALGYYAMKNGLWKNETIMIEQNGLKDRFNLIKLQKKRDEKGNDRVLFGGGAITRIDGKYMI